MIVIYRMGVQGKCAICNLPISKDEDSQFHKACLIEKFEEKLFMQQLAKYALKQLKANGENVENQTEFSVKMVAFTPNHIPIEDCQSDHGGMEGMHEEIHNCRACDFKTNCSLQLNMHYRSSKHS